MTRMDSSTLRAELYAFSASPTGYRCGPRGGRVLADLFAACPSLKALVAAAGADPDGLLGPSRSHAPWTEGEERCLSEMYWAGADIPDMAEALSRGADGVQRRLNSLGLYLRDRREKKEWS